ncbi:MAG: thiamine pyrophosphate-dependent dehydrogenase E1 component subunit alpha [Desulfurococcaceae archaeon]
MKISLSHVSTPVKGEYSKLGLDESKLIDMLRTMILIRVFEEKVEELYLREGVLMGPAHLYIGSEAIAAGVKHVLQRGDLVISHHRGHGHAIMLGIDLDKLFAELLGFKEGNLKGLGGSMHLPIDVSKGGLYASAIVGSQVPIAVGVAYAQKYNKSGKLTVVFFGDGAVNTGAFAEGAVMASFLRVPLVLLCENNVYAEFTRTSDLFGEEDVVAQRFMGYDIPTYIVDGNDPLAVYKALKIHEEKLRNGDGPIAIIANTYRLKGHGVYDKALYKPLGEADLYRLKDPIITFANRLMNEGVLKQDDYKAIFEEARKIVNESFEKAKSGSPLTLDELSYYV